MQKDQTWSALFEKVEKLAESVNAADYSISQTTLDQVDNHMGCAENQILQYNKEFRMESCLDGFIILTTILYTDKCFGIGN